MSIEDLKRALSATKSVSKEVQPVSKVKPVSKSAKSTSMSKSEKAVADKLESQKARHISLRGLEVTYWADKASSSNPKYPVKYSISVKLLPKHLKQLEAAKESAIQVYLEENNLESNALDGSDIEVKVYVDKDGDKILTFRSADNYKEIAEYDEEPLSLNVMMGKGTMINASVSAKIYKTAGGLLVTFYMNAIVITDIVERDYTKDLLESLRD